MTLALELEDEMEHATLQLSAQAEVEPTLAPVLRDMEFAVPVILPRHR
jgi:hypothetical protein